MCMCVIDAAVVMLTDDGCVLHHGYVADDGCVLHHGCVTFGV